VRFVKTTGVVTFSLAAMFVADSSLGGRPPSVITIAVNTLGTGSLNGPEGTLALAGSAAADPGPGGLSSVLTYPLLNPPSLVIGDVQLTGSSGVTELIRFNPAGKGSPGYAASLVYYSNPSDGASHLVNTPTPPTTLYPNVVSVPLGSVYTPGRGQPGYVAFVITHYTFAQISCSYSLTLTNVNVSSNGGSGSFTVDTGSACPIVPVSNSAFLTFTVDGSTVNYTVASNSNLQNRTGSITVGGETFTVNQAGAILAFMPTSLLFASGPTPPPAQTVYVSGAQGPFSVSANVPWVTVTSNSTQLPATLTISVSPANLTPGVYSATISVSVGGVPELFSLQYSFQGLPSLVPVPAQLTFQFASGGRPASQQIEIYSTSPVSFQAAGTGFVSVVPANGTTTQNITVSVDPSNLTVGMHSASLTITATGVTNSPLVVPVTLNVTAIEPALTAVVNGASFLTGPIAPGSLFTIFGSDLAPSQATATGPGLPASLNGVSITIGGIPAAVQFVSPSQINAQAPFNVAMGQQPLVLTFSGGSATVPVTIASAAPGIFLENGRGAILNQDSTLNTPQNPAAAGSEVQVYFTGQGFVTPPLGTGAPAPSTLATTNATTTATIGTAPATVVFSGLAPGIAGLGQANVMVPNLATDDYPLVLTVNGAASNSGTLSVKSQ
jgi:uncharacterized protein (TIGR03437 family)